MEPRPIAWVDRVAIVYVSDPGAELPLEHGVRPDVPQFATPHMVEPSFLIDLHTILAGRTSKKYTGDLMSGRVDASVAIRRVAHAIPIPREYSIALYMCSDEMCELLAAVDENCMSEIAHQWRALLWPKPQPYKPEAENQRQTRSAILSRLATLAQEARRSGRKLMVRLEYRQRARDAETGTVRETQTTRH